MLNIIEKRMILIQLLNELPNVEFKMTGVTKLGMVNISKSKLINDFGIVAINELLIVPPEIRLILNGNKYLVHCNYFGQKVFGIGSVK